jgi:multidrug resistance efflux pump
MCEEWDDEVNQEDEEDEMDRLEAISVLTQWAVARIRELEAQCTRKDMEINQLQNELRKREAELTKYADFQRTESYLRGQLEKQAAALDAISRRATPPPPTTP